MFGIPRLYAMIGAGVIIALFLAWVWRIDSLRAKHLEERDECRTAHAQFKADVVAKTELARLADAANKARVEREQERERAENDQEIRRRIDAAVAAVRLRGNAQASDGGSRAAPVSRPADAARDPAGASETPELAANDLAICAENTVKAQSWQEWWRDIQAIPR